MRFEIHVSENIHHLRLTEDTLVFNIAPLYLSVTSIEDEDRIDVDLHHTNSAVWMEVLNKYIKEDEPKPEVHDKPLLILSGPDTLDNYLTDWLKIANSVVINQPINLRDIPHHPHPRGNSTRRKEVYFIDNDKVELGLGERNLRYLNKQHSNATVIRKLLEHMPYLYVYTPPKPVYVEYEFVLVKAGEELYDRRGLMAVEHNVLIGIDVWVYSKQVEQLTNKGVIANRFPNISITKITRKTDVPCVGYADVDICGVAASDLYEFYCINQMELKYEEIPKEQQGDPLYFSPDFK